MVNYKIIFISISCASHFLGISSTNNFKSISCNRSV